MGTSTVEPLSDEWACCSGARISEIQLKYIWRTLKGIMMLGMYVRLNIGVSVY